MSDDIELKLNIHKVVSYAVHRMESSSDAKIRTCIFQEYKEWLGESINDEVLAIPTEIIQNELDK